MAWAQYTQLQRRAQRYRNKKGPHPLLSTIEEIECALHTTLVEEPYSGLQLAGYCYYYWVLQVGDANITYKIRSSRPEVDVIQITETKPGLALAIQHAIESGKMDGLLAYLGIQLPLEALELSDKIVM